MTSSNERIPITFIAGPEGSGKSTVLRHLLSGLDERVRVILNNRSQSPEHPGLSFMNGDILTPGGDCACCDGLAHLSAEVERTVTGQTADRILVEMCGLGEPDRVVLDCFNRLPQVRVDAVLTVVGADTLVLGPQHGEPVRLQIREADILIVNKSELLAPDDVAPVERSLRRLNAEAPILFVRRGQIDPAVALGSVPSRPQEPQETHPDHLHSFTFSSSKPLQWRPLEQAFDTMPRGVIRIFGRVNIAGRGTFALHYLAGRWELDRCAEGDSLLVFIGDQLCSDALAVMDRLRQCEVHSQPSGTRSLTETLAGEPIEGAADVPVWLTAAPGCVDPSRRAALLAALRAHYATR
jgi:G3E family GTPase